MIFRIAAAILLAGGALGALGGYGMVRWLDSRRRRDEWRRDAEWLAREQRRRESS